MLRHKRSVVLIALLGVLGVLALPSSGAALLSPVPILLTANGPSPAVQRVPAGLWPVWDNQDTVTHTVTFANGCSIRVAPGGEGQCPSHFAVGQYPYTVDGAEQASIDITPMSRGVTLEARRHGIARGSELLLHGRLAVGFLSPPEFFGPRMPVTVLARPDRHHPFHRIAVLTAKPLRHPAHNLADVHSVWHFRVRPRAGTIYIVEADSETSYWQRAWSKPFRVRVGR